MTNYQRMVHERAGGDFPGYWMNETTGELRPAVHAYLAGGELTAEQITALRAYIRQWIMSPVWVPGPEIEDLRRRVDELTSRAAISLWLMDAEDACIDPL